MSADERIQWFHKKVSERCYPNASHLSQKFGISARQAQRDVEFLRKEMSAPLEYNSSRKGYYYSSDFFLPMMTGDENDPDIQDVITGLKLFNDMAASRSVIQMQLPYTALLEIKDKMTVMNLRGFIVGEEPKHRYRCEFPSAELFLGILVSTGAEIKIISPEWLRHMLLDFSKRIIKINEEADDSNSEK